MIINDNYFLEDFLECDIDCYSSSPLLLLRPDINLYHVNKILSRLFAYLQGRASKYYAVYLIPILKTKILLQSPKFLKRSFKPLYHSLDPSKTEPYCFRT